jgi:hypothetical protein
MMATFYQLLVPGEIRRLNEAEGSTRPISGVGLKPSNGGGDSSGGGAIPLIRGCVEGSNLYRH